MKKIVQNYLFDEWDRLKADFQGRDVSLFLDFDGTLSPIVPTPEEAVIPPENRELLEKLIKIPNCRVTVVSGRALLDVRARVGLKEIVYVGNHGFEIDGPGIHFVSLCSPDVRNTMEKIKAQLLREVAPVAGILIEDKGVTLSVHYRLVDPEDVPSVEQVLKKVCHLYERNKQVRVFGGKKVFEIRPPIVWDKGAAVTWLIRQQKYEAGRQPVYVYIGDDVTDEDAFEALSEKGVTIVVSENNDRPSHADYYLRNPQEVTFFLKKILELFHQ